MDKLKEKIIKMVNDDNYIPLTPTELAIKLEIKNFRRGKKFCY